MMPGSRRSIVYLWDADYPWDVRTEKVAAALTAGGHSVTIVARNRSWAPEEEVRPEGRVIRMRPWKSLGRKWDGALGFPAFFNPRWYALTAGAIKRANADVLIVRDLPLCLTAVVAARSAGIPVVLDMAENYPAMMQTLWDTKTHSVSDLLIRNPRITALVERISLAAVDHVLVVVEESGDRLRRLGVPADRVTVVSNTPSLARLERGTHPLPPSDTMPVVTYIGNIEIVRGLIESVDAAAELGRRGTPVCLRIIGRGRDEPRVRSHAQQTCLHGSSVEFLGFMPYQEALAIVARSHVGLVPHQKSDTWDTTIPNKLFDYMAAGLPVVSSDVVPCARILHETGAGEIFRSKDPQSMASAIARAMIPGARERLGSAGIQAVRNRYNWENDSSALLRLIESV